MELKHLQSLKELFLCTTKVTLAGIQELAGLNALEFLDLSETQVPLSDLPIDWRKCSRIVIFVRDHLMKTTPTVKVFSNS